MTWAPTTTYRRPWGPAGSSSGFGPSWPPHYPGMGSPSRPQLICDLWLPDSRKSQSCTGRGCWGRGLITHFRPTASLGRGGGFGLNASFRQLRLHPQPRPCPDWTPSIWGLGPTTLPSSVAPECSGGSGKGMLGQLSCPFARLIKCPLGSWTPVHLCGFLLAGLLFQALLIIRPGSRRMPEHVRGQGSASCGFGGAAPAPADQGGT